MDRPSLLLHRIDPARNMARYFALAIEPTLFGDHAVIRSWGRLGTQGRQMIELHAEAASARAAFARHAGSKRRRGYVPAG
ncbi:MAG: WGR domain-containing protein [Aquamicrobium sp.]|uniref:WGR domain-containing protein n=1 Tax=Aquamicrobium sp. TaxID=1872579 RepID=UPI00349E52B3|nr:WGR domain-containing protein [Aquamicrobium sp.]